MGSKVTSKMIEGSSENPLRLETGRDGRRSDGILFQRLHNAPLWDVQEALQRPWLRLGNVGL